MRIELTPRGLLSAFFRQHHAFLSVFILIVLSGIVYIAITKPLYEASGSLLVKFGHDAGPDIIRSDNQAVVISQNDRREIMQSNVDILQSHNLLLALVQEIGPDKLYPGITKRVAGKDSPEEVAIRQLLKSDLTIKSSQQSNLISVRLLNGNPQVAADFVHRLFEMYIVRQSEVYSKPHTDFLLEQVKESAEKLDDSQKKLTEFKFKNGISSLDEELNQLLKQKSDAGTLSLNSLDDSWKLLGELQEEQARLLTTYRPDSPQVQQINARVALAQKSLQRREGNLSMRTGRAATKINKRIELLEELRKEYNDLSRQVIIDEANYKNYQQRSEDARISANLNEKSITPISVVDEPVAPMKPMHPRKTLILAMCLLAGMLFGGFAGLVRETLDPRFTTPEQVSYMLGVPVMASFSNAREEGAAS